MVLVIRRRNVATSTEVSRKPSLPVSGILMRALLLLSTSALLLATALSAQQAEAASETLLYSFTGGADGGQPSGGVIADASGALYGTAATGGGAQLGVVFKLTPPAAGQTKWTETVLHAFKGLDQGDGDEPQTGLLADKAGALYGATFFGGTANNGTFYRLTPPAGGSGQWTETVLYSFCPTLGNCPDGQQPVGLTAGRNGEFYAVAKFGGPLHGGSVIKLTPPASGMGAWSAAVLAGLPETSQPRAGVILDSAGALYGTTSLGGANGHGSVFKLTPPAKGKTGWALATLWSFGGAPSDGRLPLGPVRFGPDGALYGTTAIGGGANAGVVFKLVPPGPGQTSWQEFVLHRFTGTDGKNSLAGVVFDAKGALYGTLAAGGYTDNGSVFKLVEAGHVTWLEQVLHTFQVRTDAAEPIDSLLIRPSGALIGTADEGGRFGQGAVYRIVP